MTLEWDTPWVMGMAKSRQIGVEPGTLIDCSIGKRYKDAIYQKLASRMVSVPNKKASSCSYGRVFSGDVADAPIQNEA